MQRRLAHLVMAGLLAVAACSEDVPEPPPQAQVETLLQQEAEAMKREGEADISPALGVQIEWNVDSVEVRPQPDNQAEPWAGTIRFTIVSRVEELDGFQRDTTERSYDYVWSLSRSRWEMR